MGENNFCLEMRDIHKAFGVNEVLKGVTLRLSPGKVHALIGENGAGKSTLMNLLGGVLEADSGEILLKGKPARFHTPRESLEAGIAFIHQELNLINDLSIYENMFIGRELKRGPILDAARMRERTKEIFDRMGVRLDPGAMVRDLDASYKQIVEIARALLMNAHVIIMDEPTTSLTEVEISCVFDMMRTLARQGVSIVFISHKLREVLAICDSFFVLRDGRLVAEGPIDETVTTFALARHMVGHSVRAERLRSSRKPGDVVLEAERLTSEPHFRNISFQARAGEILGFTGLLGDGRSELFLTLFGAGGRSTGAVRLAGKAVKIASVPRALEMGIGYVPRDRKENGIVKDLSILENGSLVTLGRLTKWGVLDHRREQMEFRRQSEALRVKLGDERDLITSLSGGNQQKVVLAKWLSAGPRVMVFDNPTQGVDVGAKEEIYDIILRLADEGIAVVVLSNEAQEIIRLCDRAMVMYHGTISGELAGEEMTEQAIMHLAASGTLA